METIDSSNMIKPPFTTKYLEEEKQDSNIEVISLKLNPQERELINRLKRWTNYGQDSKVIKLGLVSLEKYILNGLGSEVFTKLTSNERRKPIFETESNKEKS